MKGQIRKQDRGITLIELLVVMVIIALFATFVGRSLFPNVDKARQTAAKQQIAEFDGVIETFRLDVGRFPTADEGLQALRVRPANVENWGGPYLKKDVPLDPWNHPYVYRCCPGQHGDFDLLSYGSDGQEGGQGFAEDVVSWK